VSRLDLLEEVFSQLELLLISRGQLGVVDWPKVVR
jgi:hypothetical protein